MHPSLFMGGVGANVAAPRTKRIEPLPLDWSARSDPGVVWNLPPLTSSNSSAARTGGASVSSSTTSVTSKGSKKKRKKRMIDESRSVTPTDDDVLFGRGGFTNTHPGNIRFRQKALELRGWYELPTTTKEEKCHISDLLRVVARGYRERSKEEGQSGA